MARNELEFTLACKQAHVGAQRERSVAVSANSSSEAERRVSEPALISANFSFPPLETAEKISQLIFTGSMDFGSSSYFPEFHNNMQARIRNKNFVVTD